MHLVVGEEDIHLAVEDIQLGLGELEENFEREKKKKANSNDIVLDLVADMTCSKTKPTVLAELKLSLKADASHATFIPFLSESRGSLRRQSR